MDPEKQLQRWTIGATVRDGHLDSESNCDVLQLIRSRPENFGFFKNKIVGEIKTLALELIDESIT